MKVAMQQGAKTSKWLETGATALDTRIHPPTPTIHSPTWSLIIPSSITSYLKMKTSSLKMKVTK